MQIIYVSKKSNNVTVVKRDCDCLLTYIVSCLIFLGRFLPVWMTMDDEMCCRTYRASGNMAWNSTLECTSTVHEPSFASSDFRYQSTVLLSPSRSSPGGSSSHQQMLSRPQRHICLRHIDLMPLISSAARQTIDLCQEMFADRRWNCSSITMAPRFMPDLTGGWVPASW